MYRYSQTYAILDIRDFDIRYFLNLIFLGTTCTDVTHQMANAKAIPFCEILRTILRGTHL